MSELLNAHIPLMNVMVADGLRVHICPKVATASISSAMHGATYHHASPIEYGPEYRWMCVRHPLERLVSCWAFFCNSDTDQEIKGQHDVLALGYYHGMTFDDFLDIAVEKHDKNAHTRKQSRYAGPHRFDRLCIYENLADEWRKLQDRFTFLTRPLPMTHKSNHGDWMGYYNDEQRLMAEDVFVDDLHLYIRAVGRSYNRVAA